MNLAEDKPDLGGPGMRPRLRRVTQALHSSAERHFALTDRTWTRDAYRILLARLWGFYAPLESALAGLKLQDNGIRLEERRKLPWLEADLLYLGMTRDSIAGLPGCKDLPRLADAHDGLGALYVLEGATLGGRIILRTLQAQMDISPLKGGRFFASYGSRIGAMWRAYLGALELAGASPAGAGAIEQAALETFGAFDRWFGQDAKP